jgi:Pentapeptide repeats (8 copies)
MFPDRDKAIMSRAMGNPENDDESREPVIQAEQSLSKQVKRPSITKILVRVVGGGALCGLVAYAYFGLQPYGPVIFSVLLGMRLGWAFSRQNLRRADLRRADLRRADLRRADLRRAHLYGANLQDADLRGAILRGANLEEADLRGACLQRADLEGANLRGADLRHADLRNADITNAYFEGADLESVQTSLKAIASSSALSEIVIIGADDPVVAAELINAIDELLLSEVPQVVDFRMLEPI